jgi:hypothetical protein
MRSDEEHFAPAGRLLTRTVPIIPNDPFVMNDRELARRAAGGCDEFRGPARSD